MWYMLSRESLLEAAIAHVERHGLGELSLRALAADLGTSHRMLSYHFGSRDELVAAIVDRVEQRQRDRLAELLADPDADPLEQGARFTAQILDPALWPAERLFFELYGQALAGRPHTAGFLDRVVTAWLEPVADAAGAHRGAGRRGPHPRPARARRHPRVAAGPARHRRRRRRAGRGGAAHGRLPRVRHTTVVRAGRTALTCRTSVTQ